MGVPGFFGVSCLRGSCCTRARADLTARFPDGVRYIALFSRTDEVVRWRACVEPAATPVEVASSHLGMGVDRQAWRALTEAMKA
jgi:hypothetical protein